MNQRDVLDKTSRLIEARKKGEPFDFALGRIWGTDSSQIEV